MFVKERKSETRNGPFPRRELRLWRTQPRAQLAHLQLTAQPIGDFRVARRPRRQAPGCPAAAPPAGATASRIARTRGGPEAGERTSGSSGAWAAASGFREAGAFTHRGASSACRRLGCSAQVHSSPPPRRRVELRQRAAEARAAAAAAANADQARSEGDADGVMDDVGVGLAADGARGRRRRAAACVGRVRTLRFRPALEATEAEAVEAGVSVGLLNERRRLVAHRALVRHAAFSGARGPTQPQQSRTWHAPQPPGLPLRCCTQSDPASFKLERVINAHAARTGKPDRIESLRRPMDAIGRQVYKANM
jgi:hypothetical protein